MDLVRQTKALGRLPVVNFAAGGVATPADAALMMQLGMDGVFVGSGIFKSGDPSKRARAIVQASKPASCRRGGRRLLALWRAPLLPPQGRPRRAGGPVSAAPAAKRRHLRVGLPWTWPWSATNRCVLCCDVMCYAVAPLQAVTHFNDPAIIAEVSADLGKPMVGIDIKDKGFTSYAQRSE